MIAHDVQERPVNELFLRGTQAGVCLAEVAASNVFSAPTLEVAQSVSEVIVINGLARRILLRSAHEATTTSLCVAEIEVMANLVEPEITRRKTQIVLVGQRGHRQWRR